MTFSLNGAPVGEATTDADGVAAIPPFDVSALSPGIHENVVAIDFAGDGQSGPVSLSASLEVLQVPNVSWAPPSDIEYGVALDSTQLNATSSVAGVFTYFPPAGTVLQPGPAQTLSVTFTPTDQKTFADATATVSINVNLKSTPPAVPATLVASSPVPGQVDLSWADTSNETSFDLAEDDSLAVVRTVDANVTATSFVGLDVGTVFSLVRASMQRNWLQ